MWYMVFYKLALLAALVVGEKTFKKANRFKMLLVKLLQNISTVFAKAQYPVVVLTQLFAGLYCESGQVPSFICDIDSQTVLWV